MVFAGLRNFSYANLEVGGTISLLVLSGEW